jgi:hypothetical protein
MRKAYSPGKPSELKIISIIKNNKGIKYGSSLSKYISSRTTNRNTNTKYNLKERPASHKTINSLVSKKTKPMIQKQKYQFQNQPISVKNNNNEINIHLSFGSDSINNNNTNSYLNNTNYSKITNSYEDILKEKDMIILKLENELLFNRELINKIHSNYNIHNNNFTTNNNYISLSKTKSFGNITTKRKNNLDTQNFFSSLLKNISKKSKKKKVNHGDINTNYINNINGYQNINTNRLTNVIYSSGNKENIIKGNYNNYYTNLNLNIKNKKRKKKTNSCEMNDKIKYIENLLSPHKNNKNKKNKEKKIESISFENWKYLCDNLYDKTKSTFEKCKEIINNQLINRKDLILV